ncbi:hypothetical protein DESUT3_13640 [Desulfuromonas versatilis]|uniref:Uncharacterized protein n=1 Tax=Desulfuromonas versatilis TaxID=2802975 RepID=A0ABM8HQY5_9BACT|nr:hypothetical protein [Desulfuromonas versatilis]BCR04295.1 hypothetical protein DESUT3_13640 [Desulfuromonas versatilis]
MNFVRTNQTTDERALKINRLMNDTLRMAEAGALFAEVLADFDGDTTALNRWIKQHCDCAVQTAHRYRILAAHREVLEHTGIFRLIDAYRLLRIDGNVPTTE